MFFASVEGFLKAFDFSVKDQSIVIDFSDAHIWDESAVASIDKVILKYRENDNHVMIRGLNSASRKLVDKLAIYREGNTKLSSN